MWDRVALEQATVGALSIVEILQRLGLSEGSRRQLWRAAAELGVVLPDGRVRIAQERSRTRALKLLVKSTRRTNGTRLIWAVLRLGLYPYLCAECGQLPTWNGKPLVIQIHHVNGDPTDSQPENLQFLCPNCHTQTDTFAGRNCDRMIPLSSIGRAPGSGPGGSWFEAMSGSDLPGGAENLGSSPGEAATPPRAGRGPAFVMREVRFDAGGRL